MAAQSSGGPLGQGMLVGDPSTRRARRDQPSVVTRRVGIEAGVAMEATCFTGTDKQAATYSISRLITDASLVLISHDPAAQGACNFTGCNAPLTAAR